MNPVSDTDLRELDSRTADGIVVTLLWSETTNQVWVSVIDEKRGDAFMLDVDPSHALDAFHHPYAFAGRAADEFALAA